MESYKNRVGKLIESTIPLRVLVPELKTGKTKKSPQQPQQVGVKR